MAAMLAVFVAVQVGFVLIGLSSSLRKRGDREDYLVAGRSTHPILMALAASSTNSSGFMFTGLIGKTYAEGVSAMWLMVGWVAGDYLAWQMFYRRLRERSAEVGAESLSSFLAADGSCRSRAIQIVAGLITFLFLGTYAAGQLTAGSKATQLLFGWSPAVGAVISAAMIVVYCFSGGLRASIWVNTTQAIVMIGSMSLLLAFGLWKTGGLDGLWSQLDAIDPALLDFRPPDAKLGFAAFMISWLCAGVGVIGQPHIMTIAMSIESGNSIAKARPVYYILFSTACILVGLCCRALLQTTPDDREVAVIALSLDLLPQLLVGLMVAGLFAASVSTADTQLLCCSAALSQDIAPRLGRTYVGTKLITPIVIGMALAIVLWGPNSVFELVVLAWSSLAAGLGPLVIIRSMGWRISPPAAVAVMLGGLGAALAWKYVLNLSDSVYEVLPGMAAGLLIHQALRLLSPAEPPRES